MFAVSPSRDAGGDVFGLLEGVESVTTKPPDGAGPLNVTVPVEPLPPGTLAGLSVNATSVGGSTVSCAIVGAAFPICAEIWTDGGFGFTTFGFIDTGWVWITNVAEVVPGWTTTLGGTGATAGLLLRNVTITPVEGAGWFSVTVPSTRVVPPVTLLGLSVTLLSCRGTGRRGSRGGSAVQPGLTIRYTTHLTKQGKILATFIGFSFR